MSNTRAASETFKIVKRSYMAGENWHAKKLMLGPCGVNKIAETLTAFAPYLLTAYNTFFIQTQYGVGYVTCLSDMGIRIEYFFGPKDRSYEWLRFENGECIGDAQTTRYLTPQPQEHSWDDAS
jgi:hypothetical protein